MRAASVIILCFFWASSYAQKNDSKYALHFGVGYFGDVMQYLDPGFGDEPFFVKNNPKVYGKMVNGYTVKGGIEKKLNTGFVFSTTLHFAETRSYYNDILGLFWDKSKRDRYVLLECSFARDVLKSKKHALMPVLGIVFRRYYTNNESYTFDVQGDEVVLTSTPTFSDCVVDDLGLSLGLDWRYYVNKRFYAGVSIKSNLMFDIGIETISIVPTTGIRF